MIWQGAKRACKLPCMSFTNGNIGTTMLSKLKYAGMATLATIGTAFAQESSSDVVAGNWDLTDAVTEATNMGKVVAGLFNTGVRPAVITILSTVVIVWGVFLIWKYVRRAGK